MKILIGMLLPTIAFFLQFGESNASGQEESSSQHEPQQRRFHAPVDCLETQGPPHETIQYGHHSIRLWLDSNRRRVLKADFNGSYIPTSGFFTQNNFYIRLVHVGAFQVVGYFRTNWELFGVRAPNPRAQSVVLEPSPTRWYIIHDGYKYKVTQDRISGKVQAVNLFPQNVQNRFKVTTDTVHAGGIDFIVYKAPNGRIVGSIFRTDSPDP